MREVKENYDRAESIIYFTVYGRVEDPENVRQNLFRYYIFLF